MVDVTALVAELRAKIAVADPLPWHLVGKPWMSDEHCDTYAISGSHDPHAGKAVLQWCEVDEVTIDDGDTESSAWRAAETKQRGNLECAVAAVNALPRLLDALEQAQRERDEARALLAAKWPEASELDAKLKDHDAWFRRQRLMRVAVAPVNVEGVGDLLREMRNIFAAGVEDVAALRARLATLEAERDEALRDADTFRAAHAQTIGAVRVMRAEFAALIAKLVPGEIVDEPAALRGGEGKP